MSMPSNLRLSAAPRPAEAVFCLFYRLHFLEGNGLEVVLTVSYMLALYWQALATLREPRANDVLVVISNLGCQCQA